MITHNDQLALFELISREISKNIECYAFGGNAMMFYGYKGETKDIDLLFEEESAREEFIRAISKFGYEQGSLFKVYIPEKLREKHRPLMYQRGDSRFDLFVKKIFRTLISPRMKEDFFVIQDFKGDFTLRVKVLKKEHLVLLKAITDRDKDFEDIITIMKREKSFDWQYFTDEVIWQHQHGDSWALLDAEKMMQELKRYVFIEEKYFKQLYEMAKEKQKN